MLLEITDERTVSEYLVSRFVKAYMKFTYAYTAYYMVKRDKNPGVGESNLRTLSVKVLYKDPEAPDVFGSKTVYGWIFVNSSQAREINVSSNRQASVLLMR